MATATTATTTAPQQQSSPSCPQLAHLTVECPRELIGRLIGKSGHTIKGVQLFTGAVVEVDQKHDPAQVTILASPQAAQVAESIVKDIIAGTFKGFALLRDLVAWREMPPTKLGAAGLASSPPACRQDSSEEEALVYAPGIGVMPKRQLYAQNMVISADVNSVAPVYYQQHQPKQQQHHGTFAPSTPLGVIAGNGGGGGDTTMSPAAYSDATSASVAAQTDSVVALTLLHDLMSMQQQQAQQQQQQQQMFMQQVQQLQLQRAASAPSAADAVMTEAASVATTISLIAELLRGPQCF